MFDEDDSNIPRHNIGIDAVSLLDTDASVPSAGEVAEGDQMYLDILRELPTEREKFVAIALDHGMNKTEIAYILHVTVGTITRCTQKMQVTLKEYRTGRTILGKSKT